MERDEITASSLAKEELSRAVRYAVAKATREDLLRGISKNVALRSRNALYWTVSGNLMQKYINTEKRRMLVIAKKHNGRMQSQQGGRE